MNSRPDSGDNPSAGELNGCQNDLAGCLVTWGCLALVGGVTLTGYYIFRQLEFVEALPLILARSLGDTLGLPVYVALNGVFFVVIPLLCFLMLRAIGFFILKKAFGMRP